MPLKPIDLDFFYKGGKNVHEAIAVAAKRARQINEEQKIEFNQRVELITVKTEVEGEENDVNPDQLKISLEFEKRPKPTDLAVQELVAEAGVAVQGKRGNPHRAGRGGRGARDHLQSRIAANTSDLSTYTLAQALTALLNDIDPDD